MTKLQKCHIPISADMPNLYYMGHSGSPLCRESQNKLGIQVIDAQFSSSTIRLTQGDDKANRAT